MVKTKQIELQSEGDFNIIILTEAVQAFVQSSGLREGQVSVFLQHTTGAIAVIEHEAGIIADLADLFERIMPTQYPYRHHIRKVDRNGHAHLRSILLQAGASIPVIDGKMALGMFQDIVVFDDQVGHAPRSVILQVMGE